MSQQDVYRAEKLGESESTTISLEKIANSDLSEVRSEAGCNMLLVFLLRRWGFIFEQGGLSHLAESEALQNDVVDAYRAAGCSASEQVATRDFRLHLSPHFHEHIRLSGRLSGQDFVELLLREIHPDLFPAYMHEQLTALHVRLSGEPGAALAYSPAPGLVDAHAFLLRGAVVELRDFRAEIEPLRKALEAQGLALFVAGDETNLVAEAVRVVAGLELASSCANDGAPLALEGGKDDFNDAQLRYLKDLGPIKCYLLASGPLASAYLMTGELGVAEKPGQGRFFAGMDMEQNAQTSGVWGKALAATNEIREVKEPENRTGVFLIASYD